MNHNDTEIINFFNENKIKLSFSLFLLYDYDNESIVINKIIQWTILRNLYNKWQKNLLYNDSKEDIITRLRQIETRLRQIQTGLRQKNN